MYEFAEIGLAVRTRRSDMGLSQARVADLCGLSSVTVDQLENGSIDALNWADAVRLLSVLGLNIHDILIRFSLYQRMYSCTARMNTSMVVDFQSRG